jgi:PAS domain S-box-containing protein
MWMPVIAATIGLLSPLLLIATGQDDLLPVAVVAASVMAALVITRQVLASRSLASAAAEAATRASEARLAELVRQVSDMVLVVDARGRIRYASPAATEVAGVAPEDLVGRPWLELAGPAERAALAVLLAEGLGGSPVQVPVRWRLDTGDHGRTLESTAAPLLGDPAGDAVIITCRDVTELVRLEADLEDARLLEAVGRLAGGIAHDFNNLLTAIGGYTDILLASARPGSSEHQDLLQIKQAASRGATLTAKMLAVGGREMLRPDVIDVAEVVSSSADVVRGLAGEEVDVITDLSPVDRRIVADRRQVTAVLRTLVENAADALEEVDGPRVITVSVCEAGTGAVPDPTIEPNAAGWVVLAVSDTGTGMDDSVRSHLFEPFFTTKGPGRGTGLGLASAWGTVRRQGGWIDVVTAPGEGTTVRVYWRAADLAAT